MPTWFWISIPAALALGVLAELATRFVLSRGGYYVWKPGTRMRLKIDRDTLPSLPAEARFRVNAMGERNLAPAPKRDDRRVYRVLTVGGSAVECYFLDEEATWPGQTQRLLSAPDVLQRLGRQTAYVGNIGRSGTGASEAVAKVLQRIAPRYGRLDAIFIMIGAADIVNWMRHGTPFPLQPELTTDEIFLQHPHQGFGWSPKRTALVELIRRWRHAREEVVRERAGKKLADCRAMRARAKVVHQDTPDRGPMIERYEAWLQVALRQAHAMADRVILVVQPWFQKEFTPEEAGRFWNFCKGFPYTENCTEYYSLELAGKLMAELGEAGARVAEAAGAEVLDPMPHLPKTFETFYDFIHLTREGSGQLAELLVAHLLQENARPAEIARR